MDNDESDNDDDDEDFKMKSNGHSSRNIQTRRSGASKSSSADKQGSLKKKKVDGD